MTLAGIESKCAEVDGVVFDFGGVMTVSPKDDDWPVYAYCAKFGVDRAAVDRGWQRYRNLWDGGFISFAELYGRTFADAGATIGAAQLDVLWELDAADWFRTLRTDTLALMRRLKTSGKKLGVLSNLSPESYERLFVPRCAEYRALLDAEVISGLELLFKPEEPIYRLTERRMGLPPDRLIFLDDTESNVLAARAFGWRAEIYPPFSPKD
ncbi:MAG: HAD-IA family hydrolase [Kiritimatiellae bacterium]|nr:HAD-IA family hydrolase [Kiritimatiellia bacterium]